MNPVKAFTLIAYTALLTSAWWGTAVSKPFPNPVLVPAILLSIGAVAWIILTIIEHWDDK